MKTKHKSSTIDHSEYNAADKTLRIKFQSGDQVYQYHGVPMSIASGLVNAKSAGKYFHSEIRDKFKTVKL